MSLQRGSPQQQNTNGWHHGLGINPFCSCCLSALIFGNRLPSHLLTSTVIVCRSARANHDGPGRWARTARLGHAVDWRVSWSIWNFEFNCSISNSLMEQDMESAGSPLLIGQEFALRTPFPYGACHGIGNCLNKHATLKLCPTGIRAVCIGACFACNNCFATQSTSFNKGNYDDDDDLTGRIRGEQCVHSCSG